MTSGAASRFVAATCGALSAIVVAGASGCAGGGRIEAISLDFRNIDPQRPLKQPVNLDSCRWWTDDYGTLWIAMTRRVSGLMGPATNLDFALSLSLEKLPAGAARNYKAGANVLRARSRFGIAESRLSSVAGIVAVERAGADRLRGAFRIQARRDTMQMLGGWSAAPQMLLLGDFDAVYDERGGREIVESTEGAGFERERPPASQAVRE
jgi:hypothetical protein